MNADTCLPQPKKKKSSKSKGESSSSTSSRKRKVHDENYVSDVEDVDGNEQAWVPVERDIDLNGPCFLYTSLSTSDSVAPYCLSFNSTLQSVEAADVTVARTDVDDDSIALLASDPKLAEELDGAEIVASHLQQAPEPIPHSVNQVWVTTRVPGSSAPLRYTFKSAESKFLGSDKHGSVKADMEARGPQEEWTLHAVPASGPRSQWSLKSAHGKFLAVDEVAGGKRIVRADVDTVTPDKDSDEGKWTLLVQWKHRHQARYPQDPNDPLASKRIRNNDPTVISAGGGKDQILAQQLDTFRSRAGSKYVPADFAQSMSKEERRALRKAEKEGRLAEEMLDRRTKMKR